MEYTEKLYHGPYRKQWERTDEENEELEEHLFLVAAARTFNPRNYDFLADLNSLLEAINRHYGYRLHRQLTRDDFKPENIANWAEDLYTFPDDTRSATDRAIAVWQKETG